MQKAYYTIGEISKLTNISIQTLRYYDQIDLFKPSYVDSTTNYRYYKDAQLFYLDLIKSLKYLGTPLEKIKEAQQLTPAELLDFLHEQELILQQKMRELQTVQDNLYLTQRQLQEQLDITAFETVQQKQEREVRILKTKAQGLTAHYVPSSYYSSLKKTIENNGSIANNRYGGTFPLKNYTHIDDLYYENIFTPLLSQLDAQNISDDMEFSVMPAGTYLCIAFIFHEDSYLAHYQRLYQYIQMHNIDVYPEVYEIFMPTNYSPSRDDEFIVELKVQQK